jgi:hypothetical protein
MKSPVSRILSIGAFLVLMAGCSSTPDKAPERTQSDFMGGGITLVYTDDGDLKGISSTATAPVVGNLPSSMDQAVSVATLKARRQIAEFIEVEVTSDRFMSTVSNDLQRSDAFNDNQNQQVTMNIANELRDNIRQRSQQILRGTVVDKEDYNSMNRTVAVTVVAGEKQSEAARTLRGMMAQ